jgi:hypothetical protein
MAGSTDYIKWLNRANQDIKMIEIIKADIYAWFTNGKISCII